MYTPRIRNVAGVGITYTQRGQGQKELHNNFSCVCLHTKLNQHTHTHTHNTQCCQGTKLEFNVQGKCENNSFKICAVPQKGGKGNQPKRDESSEL